MEAILLVETVPAAWPLMASKTSLRVLLRYLQTQL